MAKIKCNQDTNFCNRGYKEGQVFEGDVDLYIKRGMGYFSLVEDKVEEVKEVEEEVKETFKKKKKKKYFT